MRIISGTAGRRQIRVPGSVARPSTDRLREAIFSILGSLVEGARVMDLFAGSGAFGLECLSRGAESCVFIDDSREAQQVIQRNLKELNLDGGRVVGGDVFRGLKGERGEYDLIFADPPYYKSPLDVDYVNQLLTHDGLPERLGTSGLLVIEDPPSNRRPDFNDWKLIDQRKYGSCGILFYQRRIAG